MIEIVKLSATEHIYKEMIDCILCSSIKPPPPSGGKGHVDIDRKNQRIKSPVNKINIVLYVLMLFSQLKHTKTSILTYSSC